MFGRLRQIVEELAGRRTRFPPPALSDPGAAEGLRAGLERMLTGEGERFLDLFLHQRPIRIRRRERGWFGELEAVGLVADRGASTYAPRVRLFPLFGRFVATDLLTHSDPDQVFSLMFEQVYLVRHLKVRPDDDVLEVGLGSGVASLFAADRALGVTATDINERALAFARFNEALCPGAVPIDMRHGSIFEPLDPGHRFDLVICNPPFELVPEGESWFLHSHGGEDGLGLIRTFLDQVRDRLSPRGRLEMISWSPGTEDDSRLVDLMREALPDHRIDVHRLDLQPIHRHIEGFRGAPNYEAWRERLAGEGLTHVHFLFVRAEPARIPGITFLSPREAIEAAHVVADEWLL